MLQSKFWITGCLAITALYADPALTTIQDILYKANGTRFSGIVQINWTSFQSADSSDVPAQSVTTQVTNGYLRVQLVPTTTATPPANYTVTYNSDGKVQFTETWAVPPSASVLRVADVRVSSNGETGGGAGAVTTPVQITDVTGLQSALNMRPLAGNGYAPSRAAIIDSGGALESASGNLSDCLHVDGTSGACGAAGGGAALPAFADSESPAGVVDGVNSAFQLAGAPAPATSLTLYRNGLAMKQGADYSLSGSTISFLAGSVPQPGDVLLASYRTAGLSAAPCAVYAGAGNPNGFQLGKPCDIYLNTNGGAATTLWVKESGTATNTGWISK
ncbi:MAG TPA: hypothetical protein VKU01_26990 [Bryobacteraceae bacterium]|nr:hypothetical protein [Bryobacteraceae bacterium]